MVRVPSSLCSFVLSHLIVLIFALGNPLLVPFCCSDPTFPAMVWAAVEAAMSKSFPCSLKEGSLFPLQALGVPMAGLCPTPLTPQWVFMLPRPPAPLSPITPCFPHQGHRGTGGTGAPVSSFPVPSRPLSSHKPVRLSEDGQMSSVHCCFL